jgi:hypothetical protein
MSEKDQRGSFFEFHKQEERHPTIPLKNKVVWKNENITDALIFEMGKPSPLGLALDFSETDPLKTGGVALRTREMNHGRSADLGMFPFTDSQGRFYRDIDLKGIGWTNTRTGIKRVQPWTVGGYSMGMIGLMSEGDALHDSEIAEHFTELGIRTHRSLAIIELEELPVKVGSSFVTKPIDLLYEEKQLPRDFVPVVQVRAYGTKSRLGDVGGDFHILEDAMQVVSDETKSEFNDLASYLSWFAYTLGKNVSRMHKSGYTHGWLSLHNITMDCRLTDFDSVEKRPEGDPDPVIPKYDSIDEELNAPPQPSAFWDAASKDEQDAGGSLRTFLERLSEAFPNQMKDISIEDMLAIYSDAYHKENRASLYFLR